MPILEKYVPYIPLHLSFFLHFPLLIILFLTFFNFTSLSFHYYCLLS
ncbi:hypothetical protein MtrunA17_Chr4g0005051 [Medicago truncatula]|uniref:Transmembrane protein n=1 Tax=Medicago truncatula TaxID=3880 RepID=A0A396I1R9_MEDTR|nr:hypothetical protein MtrunA17_Chr4g0005051 [Medicago truncatula]